MGRFRFGLLLGFAIGYVLGSAAGRERYEQIRSAYQSLAASAPAQQLSGEVRAAAGKAGDRIEERATEGVNKITEQVKRAGDGASELGGAT